MSELTIEEQRAKYARPTRIIPRVALRCFRCGRRKGCDCVKGWQVLDAFQGWRMRDYAWWCPRCVKTAAGE